jgi:hypothetical protein
LTAFNEGDVMKICLSETNGVVDIETDSEFNEQPWASLAFIDDAIRMLQSLAIDVEANAGDPADTP